MLVEYQASCGGAWRARTLLIAAVYAAYVVAVLVAMGYAVGDADAETAAFVVILVCVALHFCTSAYAHFVQTGGRASIQSDVGGLVMVGDWLQSVAFGLSAGAVRRSGSELATVVVAALLVTAGQSICAIKTYIFLDKVRAVRWNRFFRPRRAPFFSARPLFFATLCVRARVCVCTGTIHAGRRNAFVTKR